LRSPQRLTIDLRSFHSSPTKGDDCKPNVSIALESELSAHLLHIECLKPFFGTTYGDFFFEFSLLHFTINLSPKGRQTCRRIWLVLYLLRITFLLGAQIERKISLADKDARSTGRAALHRAE
jgi:hypothetical protein